MNTVTNGCRIMIITIICIRIWLDTAPHMHRGTVTCIHSGKRSTNEHRGSHKITPLYHYLQFHNRHDAAASPWLRVAPYQRRSTLSRNYNKQQTMLATHATTHSFTQNKWLNSAGTGRHGVPQPVSGVPPPEIAVPLPTVLMVHAVFFG